MLSVVEIYEDATDRINPEENGHFSYAMFNRFAHIGQLRLLDWLSGDVSGVAPPEPFRTQKNRDWLSDFIVPYPASVTGGYITKPVDYYLFQTMSLLRGVTEICGDEEPLITSNIPVTLLSNDKFYTRTQTFIEGLKPSMDKVYVKQVNNKFQFYPADIGNVELEYIRYPNRAKIVTKLDTVYNQEVPDELLSTDFEWGDYAREVLVWYIVDAFSNRVREQALKTVNTMTGKVTREAR